MAPKPPFFWNWMTFPSQPSKKIENWQTHRMSSTPVLPSLFHRNPVLGLGPMPRSLTKVDDFKISRHSNLQYQACSKSDLETSLLLALSFLKAGEDHFWRISSRCLEMDWLHPILVSFWIDCCFFYLQTVQSLKNLETLSLFCGTPVVGLESEESRWFQNITSHSPVLCELLPLCAFVIFLFLLVTHSNCGTHNLSVTADCSC